MIIISYFLKCCCYLHLMEKFEIRCANKKEMQIPIWIVLNKLLTQVSKKTCHSKFVIF